MLDEIVYFVNSYYVLVNLSFLFIIYKYTKQKYNKLIFNNRFLKYFMHNHNIISNIANGCLIYKTEP